MDPRAQFLLTECGELADRSHQQGPQHVFIRSRFRARVFDLSSQQRDGIVAAAVRGCRKAVEAQNSSTAGRKTIGESREKGAKAEISCLNNRDERDWGRSIRRSVGHCVIPTRARPILLPISLPILLPISSPVSNADNRIAQTLRQFLLSSLSGETMVV